MQGSLQLFKNNCLQLFLKKFKLQQEKKYKTQDEEHKIIELEGNSKIIESTSLLMQGRLSDNINYVKFLWVR